MNQSLIHVYFMPGMAASTSIFEHIKLPEDRFRMHLLSWKIPHPNETLLAYAERMCDEIKHEKFVLIGVSFGGVVVHEMCNFCKPLKLIIISSVKTNKELPRRMKLAKATKAYLIIPTRLVQNVEMLAKYAFGKTVIKRLRLYKKYLGMRDRNYLNWAIREMINWNRTEPIRDIIHIHGDNDGVFPIRNIKDCIIVKGGTHIMIINRFKWFNEQLPKLILD